MIIWLLLCFPQRSRQLSKQWCDDCVLPPRAILEVAAAARTCKASHRLFHEYMESYMIKPIFFLSYPYSLVVIVDGLDEWDSRPNLSVERSLLIGTCYKIRLSTSVAGFN